MASLIFGAVYLGHHAVTAHRREKQRVKNYERWEGLRDEYDEQRKIQRETRSLDIQRTGAYGEANGYDEKPILTLRDQQEADDARTGWRPQESWTGPQQTGMQQTGMTTGRPRPQSIDLNGTYGGQRAVSDIHDYNSQGATGLGLQAQPTGYQNPTMRQLPPQMTGSNWDDGLPQRPQRSRPNFSDSADLLGPSVGRSSSLREPGSRGPPTSYTPRMNGSSDSLSVPKRNGQAGSRSPSIPEEQTRDAVPVDYGRPGGMMADLIEGQRSSYPAANSGPTHEQSSNPFANMNGQQSQPSMEEWWRQRPADLPTPAAQKDMQEWWNRRPGDGKTPGVEKDMQEWWR